MLIPAAEMSTSRSTRWGKAIASSAETKPPIELPTTVAALTPSVSNRLSRMRAYSEIVIRSSGIWECPKPGRSIAITR